MDRYDAHAIEQRWQETWAEARAFNVADPAPGDDAPHFYMLEMLPYPSGQLHMGHVLNYTLGDVVTHFRRRTGFTVLRPMGFDSFGLPAENAAIREGGNPLEITERNIAAIRNQMLPIRMTKTPPIASTSATSDIDTPAFLGRRMRTRSHLRYSDCLTQQQ